MNYIPFGVQEREVSRIILGLMRIASMRVPEAVSLVEGALDAGINALDTADIYADGKCEEILGDAFASRPGLRDKCFLQTKCGIRKDPDFTWFDFSKEHIVEAAERSLKRLRTDHVDCLLLHRPDALMEAEEIAEAFEILHRSGKVLNFGVSNMNPGMIEWLKTELPFPICANQVQLSCAFTPSLDAAFHVNMKDDAAVMRDGGILKYCRMNRIVIQAWSSLQYGYFEGVFLGSEKYPKLNQVIARIAAEREVSNSAVALAWILRLPGRMQAVIGTTKLSRVCDAAQACEIVLSRKEWYEIYLAAGNTLP